MALLRRKLTPAEFVAHVTRVPELDALARLLAKSDARSNFEMWTTFTQLCMGYCKTNAHHVVPEAALMSQVAFRLREHYFQKTIA